MILRSTLALAFATISLSTASERDQLRLFMQGDYVFQKNCATCHGTRGRGDGELAKDVATKPRNFRSGVFKYRSTPMGFLPTDEDLTRTIRSGVSGTMMPAFSTFSESELKAVIAYLKGMSRRWRDPAFQTKPTPIPQPPEWFEQAEQLQAHVNTGRQLFSTTCIACHGPGGKGDGPAANGLIDFWGEHIRPADLSNPGRRSGPGPKSLFRTIALGLDGTPMPGYLAALGAEKIWDLVAYVESLPPTPDPS